MISTGRPADPAIQKTRSSGNGMMRSLEIAARKSGVEILLEHRMTRIYRQAPNAGPVLGIAVDRKSGGPTTSVPAKLSSSAPAAPRATSTSAACSIRA